MTGSRGQLIGLTLLVAIAVVVDWLVEAVRGLWPSTVLIAVGGLFLWRTKQEMAPTFTGPERHQPWLLATSWFFIGAGVLGILLSLLSAL